jgi:ribokinase
MGMGRVVVVGSLNLDHVARVPHLPAPGDTVAASGYRTVPGGKGLNQAVGAARQGAPTVMIGAVGGDQAGAELLAVLDQAGIDRGRVATVAGLSTGVALINVDVAGANMIVVAAGANGAVAASQLDGFAWAEGDVALCQLEIPWATVEAALRAARAAGATTILNPAPVAGPLPAGLLSLVDVLVPNEGEATALAAPSPAAPSILSPADAASALAERRAGAVIVTLGAAGSLLARPGAPVRLVPAFPVEAVDTTGAGDAYCGALAAALAGGAGLEAAMRRASAAGSLATTRPGAVPSVPTAAEVDALLGG